MVVWFTHHRHVTIVMDTEVVSYLMSNCEGCGQSYILTDAAALA
jgi:hypothetical protein